MFLDEFSSLFHKAEHFLQMRAPCERIISFLDGLGLRHFLNFSQSPPSQFEHLQLVLNSSTKYT